MEKEKSSADEKLLRLNCTENEEEDEDGDEEEEEEALSLCDLPVKEENQPRKEEIAQPVKTEDDFVFGSWVGSEMQEPEMCAADHVFFQGQILPLRSSVSSDGGFGSAGIHGRCLSRSESMDRFHTGVSSSRSSSIRSHNSSSSTGSSIASKPRVRNRFHSHPSPSPQIRFPSSRRGSSGRHTPKSSVWKFLQVGVVRTPGMELQDLKTRNKPNFGSHNNTAAIAAADSATVTGGDGDSGAERRKKPVWMKGGCRCSVNAVETVNSRTAVVRTTSATATDMEKDEERESSSKRRGKKHAMSRRRTFEWLKELSLAADPDDTPREER